MYWAVYERDRPVFVDIEPNTVSIDAGLIGQAITPRTKAILVVDAFGQPASLGAGPMDLYVGGCPAPCHSFQRRVAGRYCGSNRE